LDLSRRDKSRSIRPPAPNFLVKTDHEAIKPLTRSFVARPDFDLRRDTKIEPREVRVSCSQPLIRLRFGIELIFINHQMKSVRFRKGSAAVIESVRAQLSCNEPFFASTEDGDRYIQPTVSRSARRGRSD
jgi:hypothetical protein